MNTWLNKFMLNHTTSKLTNKFRMSFPGNNKLNPVAPSFTFYKKLHKNTVKRFQHIYMEYNHNLQYITLDQGVSLHFTYCYHDNLKVMQQSGKNRLLKHNKIIWKDIRHSGCNVMLVLTMASDGNSLSLFPGAYKVRDNIHVREYLQKAKQVWLPVEDSVTC